VVEQVLELLQHQGRISYRALKREFDLDDEYIEDLKTELIKARKLARDEEGEVLVWTGTSPVSSSEFQVSSSEASKQKRATSNVPPLSAERRQMTVQFIDLVGSTALSTQLDPEELRTVIQRYRATCATVIRRFDGYLAKYIGDGLLVYFGYPTAHEDDAQRAVRAGLGIIGRCESGFPLPFRERDRVRVVRLHSLLIPLTLALSPKGRGDCKCALAFTRG
jgi:class 3 adenylate cyclase